jgi:transcriptional regulator with GAF, ATPase, and Fis domain
MSDDFTEDKIARLRATTDMKQKTAIVELAHAPVEDDGLEKGCETASTSCRASAGAICRSSTFRSPAILAAAPRRPSNGSGFVPDGVTLKDKVESLERQLVGELLLRRRWNQSRAASELGLSRVGLAN